MYIVETRIKTRGNKTIWMPYKQYRTTNGIENFQKRHQYLFDAGELRVTGNANLADPISSRARECCAWAISCTNPMATA